MSAAASTSAFITPNELHRMAAEKVDREIENDLVRRHKYEEEQRQLHDAFITRDLHPHVRDRFNTLVRGAVEQGKNEVLVLQFPSDWCTDGGRAINNDEADCAKTLQGFAKRAFDYFQENLAPLGYRGRIQILNYPGGKPGDVGMFVSW